MSPLIVYDGKLLIKDNKLAVDTQCCCESGLNDMLYSYTGFVYSCPKRISNCGITITYHGGDYEGVEAEESTTKNQGINLSPITLSQCGVFYNIISQINNPDNDIKILGVGGSIIIECDSYSATKFGDKIGHNCRISEIYWGGNVFENYTDICEDYPEICATFPTSVTASLDCEEIEENPLP